MAGRISPSEFKSVASAARAAGIYNRPKTITASPNKGRVAKSLLKAYGVDGCQELISVLRQVMDDAGQPQDTD